MTDIYSFHICNITVCHRDYCTISSTDSGPCFPSIFSVYWIIIRRPKAMNMFIWHTISRLWTMLLILLCISSYVEMDSEAPVVPKVVIGSHLSRDYKPENKSSGFTCGCTYYATRVYHCLASPPYMRPCPRRTALIILFLVCSLLCYQQRCLRWWLYQLPAVWLPYSLQGSPTSPYVLLLFHARINWTQVCAFS
jgi:hypothetical protein